MPPPHLHCVVCGWLYEGRPPAWLLGKRWICPPCHDRIWPDCGDDLAFDADWRDEGAAG